MKYYLFLILSLLCFSVAEAASLGKDRQREIFYNTLEDEVSLSEKRAAVYLTKMQKYPQLSGDFAQAEKMAEVKRSLVNHFKSSTAIEDSTVRSMLLEIVQREVITEKDLTRLQARVNEVLGRN